MLVQLFIDIYDYNAGNAVSYVNQSCWYDWCCQHYSCSPLCLWGWQGNWLMVVVKVIILLSFLLVRFSFSFEAVLGCRLFMCCQSSLSSLHFRLQILHTLLFVLGVAAGGGGSDKGRGGSSTLVWCLGNVCVVFSCFI